VNYTVDPLRAFDIGLLMAAMQRLPTSEGLVRMGTIGQDQTSSATSMSIALWLLLYAANSLFVYWVVWSGGAAKFEGWRSLLIVDWLPAVTWTSEQIALYTLLIWAGHTLWFLVGLFVPQARAFFW